MEFSFGNRVNAFVSVINDKRLKGDHKFINSLKVNSVELEFD